MHTCVRALSHIHARSHAPAQTLPRAHAEGAEQGASVREAGGPGSEEEGYLEVGAPGPTEVSVSVHTVIVYARAVCVHASARAY